MARETNRPCLRAVEATRVPDGANGSALVLRDTSGIGERSVVVPEALVPVVARFTGRETCEQIARALAAQGQPIPVEVVRDAARALDEALLLEGPAFAAARDRVVADFRAAPARAASHAGGAYLGEAEELRGYLDDRCLARATRHRPAPEGARMAALVSPHIDPWRGALCYGEAYAALADRLSPQADTFIVFGTSHAPMRQPFSLCRKAFDTPLGAMPCDDEAIDRIADAAGFDVYEDELNHKREHSIEFQVVFLKHLLGARPARVIPVLAGLGREQARGEDPARDAAANRFLEAVRSLAVARGARALVVAGADMAHVGPRFGDPAAFDGRAREDLAARDRASLGRATDGDADGFWRDVAGDLETRRVCGLAPIYSLLRVLPSGVKGDLLHYEQTVDADDGSIVSHAALGFYA